MVAESTHLGGRQVVRRVWRVVVNKEIIRRQPRIVNQSGITTNVEEFTKDVAFLLPQIETLEEV
jgi:hypothetical protein